jgi:hypothetical protein
MRTLSQAEIQAVSGGATTEPRFNSVGEALSNLVRYMLFPITYVYLYFMSL